VYVKIIASLRWVVLRHSVVLVSSTYARKKVFIMAFIIHSSCLDRFIWHRAYVTTCPRSCSNFSLAGQGKGPMSYAALQGLPWPSTQCPWSGFLRGSATLILSYMMSMMMMMTVSRYREHAGLWPCNRCSFVGCSITMATRRHSAGKRTCSTVVMTTMAAGDSSQSAKLVWRDVTLGDDADNSPVANNKVNSMRCTYIIQLSFFMH